MLETIAAVEGVNTRFNKTNNTKFTSKIKKAFTLAEVLVTLTIIGVVASMTIPTLHQRNTEQATVNKVKKFYTTMAQSFQKAMVEYGDVDTWGITGNTQADALIIYNYLIKDNFKIMKDCGFYNNGGCVYNGNYKLLNGSETGSYATSWIHYKILLNDGATVWMRGDVNGIVNVFYDVNGQQGPNQWGKDLFSLHIQGDKLFPTGSETYYNNGNFTNHFFDKSCKKNNTGYGCAAWVIHKGNMDYLHCDDLEWNGKQKCSK